MHARRLTALTGILTLALAILLTDSALAGKARLWYVVDGDTIRLRSGKYVGLIGVDAPETTQCGGRQAHGRGGFLRAACGWFRLLVTPTPIATDDC
jgi:endonuclease YncB( thermonuclease family)